MGDGSETNGKPRTRPVPTARMVLCPFCGGLSADLEQCTTCKGRFDPLSRQASQNAMGPWFIRNEANSFAPGCSYETIRTLIARGRIQANTIVRGPTTNQFWTMAKRAPSIANLLGLCHNCQAKVQPGDFACGSCGAPFTPDLDRQHMGLAPVQHLPGEAAPAVIAALSGPPLGIEPIEVMRHGRAGARAGSGASDQPSSGRTDDTRFWILLATAVVVITILGAVFGPELTRQLAGTRAGSGGRSAGSDGAIVNGAQPGALDTGGSGADAGEAPALDPDGEVSEQRDGPTLDERVDELIRNGSRDALETALELLRRDSTTALPAEQRRELMSVIERRLLRSRLLALP